MPRSSEVLDGLLDARRAGPRMVRFELQLLSELGFGLDLASCAATGATIELVYVSPKSGRAVSRAAGEPWQDKLLPLAGVSRRAVRDRRRSARTRHRRRLRADRLLPDASRVRAARAALADARASFIAARSARRMAVLVE